MTAKNPSQEEAEEAVKTLIRWIGDDPSRPGLANTPKRVIAAYREFFKGYDQTLPHDSDFIFDDAANSSEMIILRDIKFTSFCEHHMLPITGRVDFAYIPNLKIAGIGKISHIIDIFTKRLQLQERFTIEIARALDLYLQPKGLAVSVKASHQCLSFREPHRDSAELCTHHMLGEFRANLALQNKLFSP